MSGALIIQGVSAAIRPEREGEAIVRASFSRTALRSGLGLIAVLGLVFALALPALANDLHQDGGDDGLISWDDPEFQGTEEECADADLAAGEVLWHFIHTMTDGNDLPSQVHAAFDSGLVVDEDGFSNGPPPGNSVVMYNVITGPEADLQAATA